MHELNNHLPQGYGDVTTAFVALTALAIDIYRRPSPTFAGIAASRAFVQGALSEPKPLIVHSLLMGRVLQVRSNSPGTYSKQLRIDPAPSFATPP